MTKTVRKYTNEFRLTDRGTEYCGKVEQHDYELYLALNDIEHTKTKARHPQTNGDVYKRQVNNSDTQKAINIRNTVLAA